MTSLLCVRSQLLRLRCQPRPSMLLHSRLFSTSHFLRNQQTQEQQQKLQQELEQQKLAHPELNPAFLKKLIEKGLTVEDLVDRENARNRQKNRTALFYTLSIIIATLALSYASVPFYRLLCQKTGWEGTPMTDLSRFTPDKVVPVKTNRKITISFESDVSRSLPWSFVPLQNSVSVTPGETALAFFKAKNKSAEDIIGVATYNVNPQQVAPYFSKIQCFCFEQQQLRAGEEVDMPIFFFIDPDYDSDPLMKNIDHVVLSYTFFRARPNNYGILTPVVASPEFSAPINVSANTSSTSSA
ncbi:cytochrome c oxidase assembly protein COX11 mitochondrial precursor [Myxozyma melibiosi]|uniref:Cytochrome c oxidase assembly protein COX11 mitochondrial n=1 Tax=Myxozyma melibiosi TaxID=54550 RepID=A0ABR1F464_9ASCO